MSDRITEHEYYAEIRSIGSDLQERAQSGEFGTGEQAREEFSDALWEAIDGHSWVIYTYQSQQVVSLSRNDGYAAENFGLETVVQDGSINWSALAFGALYADTYEYLARCEDFDADDPNPE